MMRRWGPRLTTGTHAPLRRVRNRSNTHWTCLGRRMPRKTDAASPAAAGSLPTTITTSQAREHLLRHFHLLNDTKFPSSHEGARQLLSALRCVQIDPLFPNGATNHELVFQARLDLSRDDIYDAIRGHCFEHWAKQRCFLPKEAFAHYYHESRQGQTRKMPWWRQEERKRLVGEETTREILEAVRLNGSQPVTYSQLPQYGKVTKDWVEDAAPSNMTNMTLELLWGQMDIVITGREKSHLRNKKKIYVAVEHAFPEVVKSKPPDMPFLEFLVLERVHAAGLLPLSSAPAMWSIIEDARGNTIDHLISQGKIEKVRIGTKKREFLAPAGFVQRLVGDYAADLDERVRILGPLDPLMWNRDLIKEIFEFEYKWEVYTPVAKRTYGYYVMPLLYRGDFVGRIELKAENGQTLNLLGLWLHQNAPRQQVFDAVARHARLNGLTLATNITPELALDTNLPKLGTKSTSPPAKKATPKAKRTPSAKRKRVEESEEEDVDSDDVSLDGMAVSDQLGASDDEFKPSSKPPKPKRAKKSSSNAPVTPASSGRTKWKSV